MDNLILCPAGPADAEVICALAHKIWWDTYPAVTGNEHLAFMLGMQYRPDAIVRQMAWQGQHFHLALLGDVPAGFVAYGQRTGQGCTWAHVHKLYIDRAAQGYGLGRRLVALAATYAQDRGIPTLRLNVNRGNPAVGFYQRMGFTIRQRVDIPYGPYLLTDYIMELPVDSLS